jgi:O-methyltransferase involved in polyketide biosynthesis
MQSEKIASNLTGVPETLLWPLWNRASEARRPDGILRDPEAVRIAGAIDYPYLQKFGPPAHDSVLRALRFDEQIRLYLRDHPYATVAGLGEGLETQFQRVDNGRVRWLAVDLPESIALRRRFMPDTARHRNLACSALDPAWMDEVDPSLGVVVTAQGLLMYFDEPTVHALIGRCAERFPGGRMLIDTIPRSMSKSTVAGMQKTPDYRPPPMPWGLDADELQAIKGYHPNIAQVLELPGDRPAGAIAGIKHQLKRLLGRIETNRVSFILLTFGKGT